jgi:hypothetical protein
MNNIAGAKMYTFLEYTDNKTCQFKFSGNKNTILHSNGMNAKVEVIIVSDLLKSVDFIENSEREKIIVLKKTIAIQNSALFFVKFLHRKKHAISLCRLQRSDKKIQDFRWFKSLLKNVKSNEDLLSVANSNCVSQCIQPAVRLAVDINKSLRFASQLHKMKSMCRDLLATKKTCRNFKKIDMQQNGVIK